MTQRDALWAKITSFSTSGPSGPNSRQKTMVNVGDWSHIWNHWGVNHCERVQAVTKVCFKNGRLMIISWCVCIYIYLYYTRIYIYIYTYIHIYIYTLHYITLHTYSNYIHSYIIYIHTYIPLRYITLHTYIHTYIH